MFGAGRVLAIGAWSTVHGVVGCRLQYACSPTMHTPSPTTSPSPACFLDLVADQVFYAFAR